MSSPISSIGSIVLPSAVPAPSQSSSPGMFQNLLEGAIHQIESSQQDASSSIQRFLSGDGEELHTTALAVQKAGIAFDLGMQVRNKVVDAYQEIMRMQM